MAKKSKRRAWTATDVRMLKGTDRPPQKENPRGKHCSELEKD